MRPAAADLLYESIALQNCSIKHICTWLLTLLFNLPTCNPELRSFSTQPALSRKGCTGSGSESHRQMLGSWKQPVARLAHKFGCHQANRHFARRIIVEVSENANFRLSWLTSLERGSHTSSPYCSWRSMPVSLAPGLDVSRSTCGGKKNCGPRQRSKFRTCKACWPRAVLPGHVCSHRAQT